MSEIQTYPEMNEQIVEILRLRGDCDPVMLYAAQRIEELEGELEDASLAVGGALTTIEMLEQEVGSRQAKEAAAMRAYAKAALEGARPLHRIEEAVARIEELERQLAVMWGEDEPHESRSECLSCEHLATQEAWPYCRSCLLTAQLEVCDDGFGDAVKRVKELEQELKIERQARREAELELEAVLDKVEV